MESAAAPGIVPEVSILGVPAGVVTDGIIPEVRKKRGADDPGDEGLSDLEEEGTKDPGISDSASGPFPR